METYVDNFLKDSAEALSVELDFKTLPDNISNVVICGLGGSGIGGEILRDVAIKHCTLPITIVKEYEVPSFVNQNTLAIIVSYSGDTEESLSMLKSSQKKKAVICCLSSGGELEKLAKANSYPLVRLKKGYPPRAALGYSLPLFFKLFSHYGLIPKSIVKYYKEAVTVISIKLKSIKAEAKEVANKVFDKTTVIYSTDDYKGVAVRFRQQINENGKALCWHHTLPEMNHNELVAWNRKYERSAVIFLRTIQEHPQINKRFTFIKKQIEPLTNALISISSSYTNQIANIIYLTVFVDYVSIYIAELKSIDAIEVDVIQKLKKNLI